MDFEWPAPLAELAAEAREVGEEAAAGRDVREDSWVVAFDREFSLELGRRGWLGMTWPLEEGGHGRTRARALRGHRVAHRRRCAARGFVGRRSPDRPVAARVRDRPEQRRRLLPDLVAGRVTWCLGLSEPDSGSDLASLRTTATRDGAYWVLEGRKIWTTFGAQAEWCYLVARTNPRRAAARRVVGVRRRHVDAGDRGAHHPGHDGRRPLLRDGPRRGTGPRRRASWAGQDGSWRQLMSQLEHERGGHRPAGLEPWPVRPRGRTRRPRRPARAPGHRRAGVGLPHRAPARAARGARPSAAELLRRHQGVLHRARAAGRRLRLPSVRGEGRCWRAGWPGPPATRRRTRSRVAPANILRNVIGERVLRLPRG